MTTTLLPLPAAPRRLVRRPQTWVNDVHSQLNRTCVRTVNTPESEDELACIIHDAARLDLPICASGGRHSMGGQQFCTDAMLVDTRQLKRVRSFDRERGLIEVEAGIQWPELIAACHDWQRGSAQPWTIAQKQTGADTFTLGGSLSSNVHGRGLAMTPLVGDIESFTLLDAEGDAVTCSRSQNAELFKLAIGGYGLFGVISRVKLRLTRRRKLRRLVDMARADELIAKFQHHISQGSLYGDFQFSIDERSPDFMQAGILSCYREVDEATPLSAPRELGGDAWLQLLHLAYTNRREGFRRYCDYYRSSHRQIYWSDLHQLSPYLPDYAARLRELTAGAGPSSLLISELYVPRACLADFLREAAALLRDGRTPLIYGSVRLIERDRETFLPWARQAYACIVLNLLTTHTKAGLAQAADNFRRLIDLAASFGGSYYLTYHKFATREQVVRCHPQFEEFLSQKRSHDPEERFQSDWYRYYRALFEPC